MRSKIDRNTIKKLVEQGIDDSIIASVVGAKRDTIRYIRTTELGILKTGKIKDMKLFENLVKSNITDKEISKKLNVSVSTVANIRRKTYGIKSNSIKVDVNLIKKLFLKYKNISTVASELNLTVNTVSRHVNKMKLKEKYDRYLGNEYRKLSRNGKFPGRLVSLPSYYLKQLKLDETKELTGKWMIKDGKLYLEISEKHD